MNDWLEGPLDGNWRDGQAQEHISTGQIWRPGDHAPQIHPAPPPNPYGYDTGPQVPVPPPHSNGHLTNGHIGNGHLTNGHIGNGHLINGHLDNGHTGNGRPAVRTGGPGGGNTGRGRRAPSPPSRRRRITRALIVLSTVLALGSVGTYVWADTELHREVDLSKIEDRPAQGQGTNYLIVGSDSRVGLSERARKDLHTGGSADAGRRTDSMILLHTGAHGTTMVSLPRDSWVTIPSHIRPETGKHYRASKNKLNAAFSFGGPDLLVRTIEHNTGVHIDHYTEIGFAGFVGIVNAVGGVPMCLDRDIKDEKSGADLKKGCHTLDGRTALAFVRQRHQEAKGDLGRSQNQQKFLAALARKAATPGVLLDPSTVYPTMSAGLGTLIVDEDTGLPNLTSLFKAMKAVTEGDGKRLNVPVSNLALQTPKGSAVQWNTRQAKKLFTELNSDRPVTVGEKG
ncbi:LCP family protein [Streptomyces lydicamycinicus]|uniref:Putative LytR family transcriptional regulator n=1 Tax=Streptomyces lydicamycinicus TaxID=1546107 RepID=A0A0P4R2A6_9ACTN|nr:LCP family protein [Streptomyces lydicamycinicus]GAO06975.1 putative LytR family transcriptional regulator [Streptomyces lydicamycinicus]